jgi:hypothetical protein
MDAWVLGAKGEYQPVQKVQAISAQHHGVSCQAMLLKKHI